MKRLIAGLPALLLLAACSPLGGGTAEPGGKYARAKEENRHSPVHHRMARNDKVCFEPGKPGKNQDRHSPARHRMIREDNACSEPGKLGKPGKEKEPAGSDKRLVVRAFPSNRVLAGYDLGNLDTFSLTFIHSVSETPVRDDYRFEKGGIVQSSETFMTHEAGLPSGLDGSGTERWEHRDGKFILHMRRSITRLVVRTDRNYRNRLIMGDTVVNLNQWEDQALEILMEKDGP